MVDDRGFLKEDLSEDGLHPRKTGYDVVAALTRSASDKALKKK